MCLLFAVMYYCPVDWVSVLLDYFAADFFAFMMFKGALCNKLTVLNHKMTVICHQRLRKIVSPPRQKYNVFLCVLKCPFQRLFCFRSVWFTILRIDSTHWPFRHRGLPDMKSCRARVCSVPSTWQHAWSSKNTNIFFLFFSFLTSSGPCDLAGQHPARHSGRTGGPEPGPQLPGLWEPPAQGHLDPGQWAALLQPPGQPPAGGRHLTATSHCRESNESSWAS